MKWNLIEGHQSPWIKSFERFSERGERKSSACAACDVANSNLFFYSLRRCERQSDVHAVPITFSSFNIEFLYDQLSWFHFFLILWLFDSSCSAASILNRPEHSSTSPVYRLNTSRLLLPCLPFDNNLESHRVMSLQSKLAQGDWCKLCVGFSFICLAECHEEDFQDYWHSSALFRR